MQILRAHLPDQRTQFRLETANLKIIFSAALSRVRFRGRLPGPLRAHASVPARGASMLHFDRDIGIEPPEEWRAEIDQTAVPGGIFAEIVFFHKESKTLILADTIINLELDMIRQPWRFAAKLTGMYYPRGQIFFGMRLPLLLQKRKTRAAVQKMLSWQPERIILSHGRWFDSNASETLQRTFGWAL